MTLLSLIIVSALCMNAQAWIPSQSASATRTVSASIYLSTSNHNHLDRDEAATDLHAARSTLSSPLSSPLTTSRRTLLQTTLGVSAAGLLSAFTPPAHAIGPVKISLKPVSYTARPCPPDVPIPGEKAMKGMRGLCVTVTADLQEATPKELSKVGVYGFVVDGETGNSVLANNPDLSTDAGQFAMVPQVNPTDSKVTFEFVAAVPVEKDLRGFDNGIGPLEFTGLKIISFPGGEQFGAISPCEMNEFSEECEAWEAINGPYTKGTYMMKSNPRTKGR
jgi:hypothetical protein